MERNFINRLGWRNIGPVRGGRVSAVAGDPSDIATFYFGACAGGVWKSTDAGTYWRNVTDGQLRTSAIGALSLAPSDANVIYAGTGEGTARNDTVHGDGVYRSDDAGVTWRHLGLEETLYTARVRVSANDPDTVFVAALGDIFGPSEHRGVYRSQDGGRTWERVLYRHELAGAADLWLDPSNSRILYATLWHARRYPWAMESGGAESSLYRSLDGGDTWTELSGKPGLPEGLKGRMGICASPAKPNRVWALIEAAAGGSGLYRSEDRGDTWERLSDRVELVTRPWYYSHVVADPRDPDTLYVPNSRFWKSVDGGRTWDSIPTPHHDNHDLWIDPANPLRLILGNDGGACVSLNGGETFSTIYNQPTAQIYRVDIDSNYPRRVLGTQQDNSAVRVPLWTDGSGIRWDDCDQVGFSESGDIASDPLDPDVVFSGAVGSAMGGGGPLRRYEHRTGHSQLVTVWPLADYGSDPSTFRHRFGWTYPITFSRHDPTVLYAAGERVFRSLDHGASWEVISPDLTRNDPAKLVASGGPITKDTSGAEVYCTIHVLEESPHDPQVLWTGSDDGRVHVTRDGGSTWTDVTPPDIPEWATVASIEVSRLHPDNVYVAAHHYRFQDRRPYLWVTRNGGDSWTDLSEAFPAEEFLRVVRADPSAHGLFFAGTETGLFVSMDDGGSWHRFGGGLPVVPVYDLAVTEASLVAATHGRSFWVLDDLTPLRESVIDPVRASVMLFAPLPAVRRPQSDLDAWIGDSAPRAAKAYLAFLNGPTFEDERTPDGSWRRIALDGGPNPPRGVTLWYWLGEELPADALRLRVLDQEDREIASFESEATAAVEPRQNLVQGFRIDRPSRERPSRRPGLNSFICDLRVTGVRGLPDTDGVVRLLPGPVVAPGEYRVQIAVGELTAERCLEVVADPRVKVSDADLSRQYTELVRAQGQLQRVLDGVLRLRQVRAQVSAWSRRSDAGEDVMMNAKGLVDAIDEVEQRLTDPGPPKPFVHRVARLDYKLSQIAVVIGTSEGAPTRQALEVLHELQAETDAALTEVEQVLQQTATLESLIAEEGLPLFDTTLSRPLDLT